MCKGHLFAYPRFALTPAEDSTHKAFIPFQASPPHLVIARAKALSLASSTTIELDREFEGARQLQVEATVLATGTKLTPPGTLPVETKSEGIEWFLGHQKEVQEAKKIVIVGGGAVGVREFDLPCYLWSPR
jgi:hypothetical protein